MSRPVPPRSDPSKAPQSFGERTIQPLNEASVLIERAAADAAIAQPVAPKPAPMPGDTLGIPSASAGTQETLLSAEGSLLATTPVVATAKPTGPVRSFEEDLPPVDGVSKKRPMIDLPPLDEKPDDTVIVSKARPWLRLAIAGVLLPILWMAIGWGVNYLILQAVSEAIKADPKNSVPALSDWLPLIQNLPYIFSAIVAIVGTFILRHPRVSHNFLLACGIALVLVGVSKLAPLIDKNLFLDASVAMSLLFGERYALAIPITLVMIGAGVVSAFGLYFIGQLCGRFLPKWPALVVLALIAALPLGAAITLEKLSERAQARGEPAYTIVGQGDQARIIGAKGFAEGKRLFMSKPYAPYDASAFEWCIKGSYSQLGITSCAASCVQRVEGKCVFLNFSTAKLDDSISEFTNMGETCNPAGVNWAFLKRIYASSSAYAPRMPEKPVAVACETLQTPGGRQVAATAEWDSSSSRSTMTKEYFFIKDDMVAYLEVKVGASGLDIEKTPSIQPQFEEDLLGFIDTFDIVQTK